jgi:rRNA processing protein Krr1/Pno1
MFNLRKSSKTFIQLLSQGINLNSAMKMLSEPEHLADEYQCER